MRNLFVVVLLCSSAARADNIADLKSTFRQGLPVFGEWSVGGFSADWHVQQVRSGHRLIPSFNFPLPANQPLAVGATIKISTDNAAFVNSTGLPFSIRTTNIPDEFVLGKQYRVPLVIDNLPQSPLVWTRATDGTLNDQRLADNFCDPAIWQKMGSGWAASAYVANLQQRFPAPEYVLFSENNEPALIALGKCVAANPEPPPPYLVYNWDWRPGLDLVSLRASQYASTNTAQSFYDLYYNQLATLYQSFFTGFKGGLTSWNGKVLVDAYDSMSTLPLMGQRLSGGYYEPQGARGYDGLSAQLYSEGTSLTDFTGPKWLEVYDQIPRWEQAEALNPNSFRQLFLKLTGGACLAGKVAGKHEVITPAAYAGNVVFRMWSLRQPGRAFLTRHWVANSTLPSEPLFNAAALVTLTSVDPAAAAVIGTATQDDYLQQVMSGIDRICDDPTLRKFWLTGTPVVAPGISPTQQRRQYSHTPLYTYPFAGDSDNRCRWLDVDVNTPRDQYLVKTANGGVGYSPAFSIKVWATAAQIGNQYLLYLWTPCALTGSVTVALPGVGPIVVDAPTNAGAYWFVETNVTRVTKVQ